MLSNSILVELLEQQQKSKPLTQKNNVRRRKAARFHGTRFGKSGKKRIDKQADVSAIISIVCSREIP